MKQKEKKNTKIELEETSTIFLSLGENGGAMIKMKNVPVSLSLRCLNSSFYPFVGPIPWLYHTQQRFLLLNTLFLLLSSILPADIDLGKRGTRVKDRAKNWAIKRALPKPKILVPWSFFAPKPNGNTCYAGYDFYPDLGSDTSSVWNFCSRSSEVILRRNQWWRHEMLTFTQTNEKQLLSFRETHTSED